MKDSEWCFAHDPDHRDAAQEARRLGGVRRRREGSVRIAYDLEGLATLADYGRLLEIAGMDALSLENGIARTRALTAVAATGLRLVALLEFDRRLAAVEAALRNGARHDPEHS